MPARNGLVNDAAVVGRIHNDCAHQGVLARVGEGSNACCVAPVSEPLTANGLAIEPDEMVTCPAPTPKAFAPAVPANPPAVIVSPPAVTVSPPLFTVSPPAE